MTQRDRPGDPSGRREVAGDAPHRQGFPTPSDGPPGRPERRLAKAFGRRRAELAMWRIAAPHSPSRKPWQAVPMGHYHRSLVLRGAAGAEQDHRRADDANDGAGDIPAVRPTALDQPQPAQGSGDVDAAIGLDDSHKRLKF